MRLERFKDRYDQKRALARWAMVEAGLERVMCAIHHNELHRSGAEMLWWKRLSIDPLAAARTLWEKHLQSHGENDGAARVA